MKVSIVIGIVSVILMMCFYTCGSCMINKMKQFQKNKVKQDMSIERINERTHLCKGHVYNYV